jgi:hypothetical protein
LFVHVTVPARSSKDIVERVHSTKATVESIVQRLDDVTASSLYKDQLARNRAVTTKFASLLLLSTGGGDSGAEGTVTPAFVVTQLGGNW